MAKDPVNGPKKKIQQLEKEIARLKKKNAELEENPNESEKRFSRLFEQSPVPIEIFTLDGTQAYVNLAWKKLWNVPEDYVPGAFNVFKDPQVKEMGILDLVKRTFAGEITEIPEARFTPANSGVPGEARILHSKFYPVKDSRGKVESVIVSHEDITGRKKAEEEKRKLEEQLFQAQKMESIGRLAGGVAHDFNNILTSIMGYTEFLKIKFSDPETSEGKAVNVIINGAERAAHLTKQLLGFARGGKYNPVPLDINEVLQETIKVLEKIFEKKYFA